MHILLVCKTLPHVYKGGIQTHTWQLSGQLLKMGHEVSILTSGSLLNGLICSRMDGRILIQIPYLPLRKLPLLSSLGDEWAFNNTAAKWILKLQNRFDIIHLQGRSGCMVLDKKSLLSKPILATLHGFKSNEYAFENTNAPQSFSVQKHGHFAAQLEQLALHKSDAVIAVSKFLEEDAIKRSFAHRAPISIIPNGIEIAATPKANFSTKKLLFVGRLDRLKGLYELLDALPLTKAKTQLDIIGDGPEMSGLKSKVETLGLSQRVQFLGAKNNDEVKSAIEASYALILPSFLETQGIVLMEANERCKPVLASDIPGIRSVVEHRENGLLFKAGNTQDMAKKIDYLLENEALAIEMGKSGRKKMETEFSWQRIAKQTEQVYKNLLFQQKNINIQPGNHAQL